MIGGKVHADPSLKLLHVGSYAADVRGDKSTTAAVTVKLSIILKVLRFMVTATRIEFRRQKVKTIILILPISITMVQ